MTNVDRATTTVPNPFPHIVHTPGYVGGDARIDGTRLAVWLLVLVHRNEGSVERVAAIYPWITPDLVQEALDYYAAHPEEIDQAIAENDD